MGFIEGGPAAFYAAEQLFNWPGRGVRVDVFDLLPTPYAPPGAAGPD
jgi:hypothetical protein